jgi:phage terminase Nu1 subunit (DNA packaging protein)
MAARKKTAARRRPAKKAAARKAATKKTAARRRPAKKAATRKRSSAAVLRETLTKALGGQVTRDMVREWTSKGYPVEDPAALVQVLLAQRTCPAWLEEKHATPAEDQAAAPTVAELKYQLLLERVRKTAAEASIKELEAAAARQKWLTREEAEEAGRQIGSIFRSHLLQVPNSWTPILEGLPAGKMRDRMRKEIARILQDVERLMIEKGAPPG